MKQRKPNRLNGYDYSKDNLYFVTSCVKDMVCCFGDVVVGTGRDLPLQVPQMILNDYGKIAEKQWYWLAGQYPCVVLHEFIAMPNHMHGVIEINRDALVGTGRDLSIRDNNAGFAQNLIRNNENARTGRDMSVPKIKSLSGLTGAYKTTVSSQIHLKGYTEFAWQRSFYDHIIRDEKSYESISTYILNNPKFIGTG